MFKSLNYHVSNFLVGNTYDNPLSGGGSGGDGVESFLDQAMSMNNLILALGGFWVVACLIIAGMKLAGSSSNPQKRTEGLIALAFVAVGAFVIVKSSDIAGWVANM